MTSALSSYDVNLVWKRKVAEYDSSIVIYESLC